MHCERSANLGPASPSAMNAIHPNSPFYSVILSTHGHINRLAMALDRNPNSEQVNDAFGRLLNEDGPEEYTQSEILHDTGAGASLIDGSSKMGDHGSVPSQHIRSPTRFKRRTPLWDLEPKAVYLLPLSVSKTHIHKDGALPPSTLFWISLGKGRHS
jgi:hypothetical protein